jgi:very-short-patch-repair endonuclease
MPRSVAFDVPFDEFWRALSAGDLGVAFKRQVPIGRFIADFLAPSVRLVVEVDGGYQSEPPGADARRDRKLRALGYRVVRVEAELVMQDVARAIETVRVALAELSAVRRARML